jgi:hypothetical protein
LAIPARLTDESGIEIIFNDRFWPIRDVAVSDLLQTLNCLETGRLIVETKPFGFSTALLQATDAWWVFGRPPHGNAMKVTQGSQAGSQCPLASDLPP